MLDEWVPVVAIVGGAVGVLGLALGAYQSVQARKQAREAERQTKALEGIFRTGQRIQESYEAELVSLRAEIERLSLSIGGKSEPTTTSETARSVPVLNHDNAKRGRQPKPGESEKLALAQARLAHKQGELELKKRRQAQKEQEALFRGLGWVIDRL